MVDLLAVKDPLSYQAVSVTEQPNIDYDTSDEAEAQRMRERGLSDGAIYDEWSGEDDTEWATIKSEVFGS